MSDKFTPIPLRDLLLLTLEEVHLNRFLGISGSLFFHPLAEDRFQCLRYGVNLETPVGVAAGPHTQLAQNIVAAWLCGSRYIELKTIQTLDELEVTKPCIHMNDEGYNCEWSQELKVHESFHEYLNAWVLIHILRKELGFSGPPGMIFNMSAGYDYKGIRADNVQWFFDRMTDCSRELKLAKQSIRDIYPDIETIDISSRISDSITLSTMHGCPPDEIGKIGLYLIRERKFHTTIKLNPTLLGAEELRGLLNGKLGYETKVPDVAFEHDLSYPQALDLLNTMQVASVENDLQFSVKLTNTLECSNNKETFDPKEPMMYMSGRALHPISVSLAKKLQNDFGGQLDISFSAGVDCFNVTDVLACGMQPVTVCTDLLKPGGYGRLGQYFETIRTAFHTYNAVSLDDYVMKVAGIPGDPASAALHNLNSYAARVAGDPAYLKQSLMEPSIKTSRELGWFDCIHAPCVDACPTNQDIPEYMHYTAAGDFSAAFETILQTNPFPSVTGMVCDHLCQAKCTRINYDEALKIREIKRFVSDTPPPTPPLEGNTPPPTPPLEGEGRRSAAIIGAGPAGLSCAWFLRQAGFEVDVFEQRSIPGGMVSAAIPAFRLTPEAVEKDIQRILSSGVQLYDNHLIDGGRFKELQQNYNVIFLGAGAQKSTEFTIAGNETSGVIDPLDFLFDVRQGRRATIGREVVIIGGGNTAMDAARTAYRMVGKEGTVTILYRRTVQEMPADHGEIEAVQKEGIRIIELAIPLKVLSCDNRVSGLLCSHTVLMDQGKSGRPVPIAVPGSEFEMACDTIIPAIGQKLAIDFLPPEELKAKPDSYKTLVPKLYIGGDALRGASTAINAIGDGRKAASEIIRDLLYPQPTLSAEEKVVNPTAKIRADELLSLLHRKAVREFGVHPRETAPDQRRNFDLVMSSYSTEEALKEASRCLRCDTICNVCVSVCPNLANFGYEIEPVNYSLKKAVLKGDGQIVFEPDKEFSVEQRFQVLNVRDLCNECGNCTTFCPTGGRPFTDKPGLCLSVNSLNREGSGFYLSRLQDREMLIYKEKDNIRTLTLTNGYYVYETNQVRAKIDPTDFNLLEVTFLTPCVREFRFEFAAEMSVVMHGVRQVK